MTRNTTLASLMAAALTSSAMAAPQSFLAESSAPGWGFAMADSGRYVVGVADISTASTAEIAIWSPTGTWTEIGGADLVAIDISNDGAVVLAKVRPFNAPVNSGSVYDPISGWQPIAGPTGRAAHSLSADGNVIAARVTDPVQPLIESSYTWNRSTGAVLPLQPLSSTPGITRVHDLTETGHLAVGESGGSAVSWDAAGVPTVLIPAASNETARAYTVSRDGTFIGGSRTINSVETPFVWSAATGVVDLPVLGETGTIYNSSHVTRISADGQTIIGMNNDNTDPHVSGLKTFVWTANDGTERLTDLLLRAGMPGSMSIAWRRVALMSDDGERFFDRNIWVDANGDPGTNFCGQPFPNSTGTFGQITATGSVFAELNDLTLTASSLPPQQFGIFIGSNVSGLIAMTSNIDLCVNGSIRRFVRPGQVKSSGASGTINLAIELSGQPGNILPPVLPGSTWYFQCWFRDSVGMGSAMTNAVGVTFE